MVQDAECASEGRASEDGITVEAEMQKRAARKSRKIARRLKRAAQQNERMASELEGNVEEWFSWISRGSRPALCLFLLRGLDIVLSLLGISRIGPGGGPAQLTRSVRRSGAFCSRHDYDPSMFRKRTEQAESTRHEVRPATARLHASSTHPWGATKLPASAAGSLSARGPPPQKEAAEQEEPTMPAAAAAGEVAGSEASRGSSSLSRHRTPRTGASRPVPGTPASLPSNFASRPPTALSALSGSQSMTKTRQSRLNSAGPAEFNAQNVFLTTRNKGFTRSLAASAEDCRLGAWLQREQIRRDQDKVNERKKAAADEEEKKRIVAVAASLNHTGQDLCAGADDAASRTNTCTQMLACPTCTILM